LPQPQAVAALSENDRADVAFAVRSRIIGLRTSITARFLEIGELLDYVHRCRLWQGFADSFAAFCADPEVDIRPSTAYRLLRLYREAKRVGVLGHPLLEKAGIEKALLVLPSAVDHNDAVARLSDAANLPETEVEMIYGNGDPQERAIASLLARLCTLNHASRTVFLVRAYFTLAPEHRIDFWRSVEAARVERLQADWISAPPAPPTVEHENIAT
jgi:hypothetical protein